MNIRGSLLVLLASALGVHSFALTPATSLVPSSRTPIQNAAHGPRAAGFKSALMSSTASDDAAVDSSTSVALESTGGASSSPSKTLEILQTSSYFMLWYLFNIGYNIYNKQALNVLSYPWTVSFCLSMGWID